MKLDALQTAIGHRFSRPELLQQAVTHRSFGSPHNERLEFLGVSVVNCVTAIALFERFSELREGDMSRLRANLVRQEALHRLAEGLKLGEYLRLGEGEMKSGGHRRPSILADALEAIFAAVFLDAGFEAAKPGATYSDIHHACMRVIAERLHDWGILPVDVEESLSPEGQQHRRWLACGVAHHLGLDVHDCAQARYESYQNAKIRPGMIFTIEPGLYFREDDLLIPPEYRGIGIRIEDDVLMTEDGPEWISAGIPKQIDDVEAWMADMAAEGAKA